MRSRSCLILPFLLIPAVAQGQASVPSPSDASRCSDPAAMPAPEVSGEGAALHGEIGGNPPSVEIPNVCDPPIRVAGTGVLYIRNMGTPLYVIDGVPLRPESFNALPSDRIESIRVMSAEEATDEFGPSAVDGVIVVQTRPDPAVAPPQ